VRADVLPLLILATLRSYERTSVAFPSRASFISKRRELNGAELSAVVADGFRVRRQKVPANHTRLTDYPHQPSHRVDNPHTSIAIEPSRLFFAVADRRSRNFR
jgi:hypothetical protein